MKTRSLGLLAGLVFLLTVSQASAATVYITYTGTVVSATTVAIGNLNWNMTRLAICC
jgi:hypothetical protein